MILRHIKDSWNYDVEVGALEGLLEDQKSCYYNSG